jgi:hypothetical protein
MGYMRHHAILITTFSEEDIKSAHEKAVEIFGDTVSEVRESKINGYRSFAVFPDGSKEGWTDSDAGDSQRAQFVAWLNEHRYEDNSTSYDWVEVQYGDDNHETKIINDSDELIRTEGYKE